MLVSFEKNLKKIEEISKILLKNLKVFKENLEVLEIFNKMYSIMYAFHRVFFKKTLSESINLVYITYFFKIWGGQMHYWPPRVKSGGAMAPWPPLWRTPCFTGTCL